MDAHELRGLAVVTVAEAERLGRVDDVLFETTPLRAKALRVSTDTGQRLVAFDSVRSIGPDAITTQDVSAAAAAAATLGRSELPGLSELAKRKVVDEGGSLVGRVTAVDVDPHTGAVAHVDVRRGDVLGIGGETTRVALDDIVTVGPELITVREVRFDGRADS